MLRYVGTGGGGIGYGLVVSNIGKKSAEAFGALDGTVETFGNDCGQPKMKRGRGGEKTAHMQHTKYSTLLGQEANSDIAYTLRETGR